jgi:endoglucanase
LHKYWTETIQESIQPYVNFSQQRNVPLRLGESGENTDEWINSLGLLLEKNGINWCFWTYKKMDATSCVVSVPSLLEWSAIAAFADHPRATFEEVRQQRPPQATVTQALSSYLENIKLQHCTLNPGFVKALGLSVPEQPLGSEQAVQAVSLDQISDSQPSSASGL